MGLLDWLPFRKTRFPIGLIEESLRECPKCGEAYLVSAGAFCFGLIDSKRRCNGCRSHDGKEPCPDWIPVIKPQAIYRRWGGEAEAMAAIHQALLSYFQQQNPLRLIDNTRKKTTFSFAVDTFSRPFGGVRLPTRAEDDARAAQNYADAERQANGLLGELSRMQPLLREAEQRSQDQQRWREACRRWETVAERRARLLPTTSSGKDENLRCTKCDTVLDLSRDKFGTAAEAGLMAVLGVKQVRLQCPRCRSVFDATLGVGKK